MFDNTRSPSAAYNGISSSARACTGRRPHHAAVRENTTVSITRSIKQHPVWSFCLLTLLWSFGWWSLILVVIPVGTLFDPPLHPAAIACMLVGGLGPSLAGIGLSRLTDGTGSVRALLGSLGAWRVGWWWLAIL